MTNEERDLIASFLQRVGGAPAAGAPVAGQGAMAPLPPVDPEADRLIADLFDRYPEARYRVTQMAFVQEHALVEAQNRIARLQWELQQARQAQAPPTPGSAGSPWGDAAQAAPSRGIFGSLFGGPSRPAAPPPQYAPPPPQYAPPYAPQYAGPPPPVYPAGYNAGLFPQQGTGFFGSALRTAAGVAGGVLAADALMSLFSPHQGFGGGFGGGGFGGGFGGPVVPGGGFAGPEVVENVTINNPPQGGNPWGPDPMDAGGAPKDDYAGNSPAPADQAAWGPAPDQGGGWQDASNAGDGGWQDASNAGDGGWSDSGNDGGGGDSSSDA